VEHGLVESDSPSGNKRGALGRRIVVADEDPAMARFFEAFLVAAGHQVCIARTGWQLVELCRLLQPDLLICEVNLPDLDGLAAIAEVCRVKPVPVILVSGRHDPGLLERVPPHVLAYCVKPIKEEDLAMTIALVGRQFERLESLQQKIMDLQQTLEDRKLIERAKGIVMKHTGLVEEEAYRRLTKMATDSNRKLVDVAAVVLEAGDLFRQLEQGGEGKRSEHREVIRCADTRQRAAAARTRAVHTRQPATISPATETR
jgi:two-component system, response regulator PdtaR